ncbi:MAG: phenylalanine--tRNA ligase subunit alpha, partial [Actinobacteria bacterium]|nr:phenylalanine--tRNA ligase subunit alpha [Actinomycetota bacterium]
METNKELEDLQKRLNSELEGFKVEIAKALNLDEVQKVKTRYIGPKSLAIKTLGNIGSLSRELRPLVGKEANIIKKTIEAGLEEKEKQLKSVQFNADLRKEKMDLSLPGRHIASGRKNIISQVIDEIEAIFVGMGFDIAEGPEVETDYYNFEALNTPADHPAR